jgi:hypothetical protein
MPEYILELKSQRALIVAPENSMMTVEAGPVPPGVYRLEEVIRLVKIGELGQEATSPAPEGTPFEALRAHVESKPFPFGA